MTVTLSAALAGACATGRAGLQSRVLDVAPYYHTYAFRRISDSSAIGHLPVQADNSLSLQGVSRPLIRELVGELTRFLDTAGWTLPIGLDPGPRNQGPEVYFGRADSLHEPREPAYPSLIISGYAPSKRWRMRLADAAALARVDFVVCISLGVSNYGLRPSPGLTLNKEVQLGTNYTMPVSWLNAIDDPVPVLQLTGALLTADGQVLRVGAEGLLARKPHLALSVLGIQQIFTDDDLRDLLAMRRREDVEGAPLTWRVALQNLVAQLLGRDRLVIW